MRSDENGAEICENCQGEIDSDESLTLVDSFETDIDTGNPYPIQIGICADCLEKWDWEQTKRNAANFNRWSLAHLERFVDKED